MSNKIAITLGDPAGVGPEVVLKAVNALLSLSKGQRAKGEEQNSQLTTRNSQLVIVGSEHIVKRAARDLGILDILITAKNISVMNTADNLAGGIEAGKPSPASARSAIAYIDRAVEMAMAGEVDAIATAPVSKRHIADAGINFTGHTGYIAGKCGAVNPVRNSSDGELALNFGGKLATTDISNGANPVMTFFLPARNIFVALVTTHIRLADVPKAITQEAVLSTIKTAVAGLRKYFGVTSPKVAVLGLNPHAGEGGLLGDEERNEIVPAIDMARKDGISCEGPFAADGFFRQLRESPPNSQLIIAMYHDQGLVGVKTLGEAVNVTLGLPFLRTSCDHGTAFDIASRGIANETSMRQAIELAAESY